MKKKLIFKGVGTALITPFKNGKLDTDAVESLIEEQIEAGVGAVIVGGTTGEASTLTEGERQELYTLARNITRGRIPLVLGTGANDTATALRYTRLAQELRADGALIVTPYYNRGTEEGIFLHYKTIAESCSIPIILYNVPSRTGVNISIENLTRLATYENIVGIKEASGSLARLMEISALGDKLPLYAGNDSELYSVLSLGGVGGISVVSNPLPRLTAELYRSYSRGDRERSLSIQRAMLPFISALFAETNPSPVKYVMGLRGRCTGEIRLPLTPPTEELSSRLRTEYEKILALKP